MHKYTLLLMLLSVAFTAQAATPAQLQHALAHRVAQAQRAATLTDDKPYDNAVVDMEMTVEFAWKNSLTEVSEGPQTNTKPCSAVRIDKNWLLASLECRGYGTLGPARTKRGTPYKKEVAYRTIKKAAIRSGATNSRDEINENKIYFPDQESYQELAPVMLLQLDLSDEDLADEVEDVSIAPLLFSDEPFDFVKGQHRTAYINRERYCLPGRCSSEVEVNNATLGKKACYETNGEWINGDAGDPLFISLRNTHFLAGFNNAKIVGDNPQSGHLYRSFNHFTRDFIVHILQKQDPAALKRVKAAWKIMKGI